MTYHRKLRDTRWQKLRLEVLQRDNWRCQGPACAHRQNPRVMLVVHHRRYVPSREPWDYPLEELVTLCEKCHDRVHQHDDTEVQQELAEGNFYAWREITGLVEHEPYGYLTEVAGQIICGCLRLDLNPDAPWIVLPGGRDPQWAVKARLFQQQGTAIPIFTKAEGLPWEFVGGFRMEAITENAKEIQIHRERTGLSDIGLVMFLTKG